ncbi:ecto-ADP-ribosyltransferase 5-like [Cololabis saira]|uniref:ecto-ADP-ribosyltransferase 5-like n=1 Tax=Cololabis saira TaxID=129043 RepID=UPI002AD40D63|nr:ecto-ADP-ribosyltransferase 5-like [Cololabis saira]
MATWTLIFVILGVTVGAAQTIYPLDKAPNSVDDMYYGCKEKMLQKVKKEFLPEEKNKVENFRKAWNEANKYYDDRRNSYTGKDCSSSLSKEQIMALHAYTRDEVYSEFNKAVRTDKDKYKTTFMYHTLHFFLTDAIQVLKSCPESQKCFTTYRGVRSIMENNVKEFRFGSFASSSMDKSIALEYGNKTCFEIYTCFGADITQYSDKEREKEVLIPPYEVFEVVKLEKQSENKNLPCDYFYTVKSTEKTQSDLNCALF